MKTTIWFDMDGTIANLYAVEGWLEMLRAYSTQCYVDAQPMMNFAHLARLLHKAQQNGYEIGIISWSSKCSTEAFDRAVEVAKKVWLHKHLPSVEWDNIKVVPYGQNKSKTCKAGTCDILFDDEAKNRETWAGKAYTPDMIVEILKKIAERA